MAVRSKAWVSGRSLAETAGSNPTGARMSVCCERCVLWGNLCDRPIVRPEEFHRARACVCVCVSVIEYDQMQQ